MGGLLVLAPLDGIQNHGLRQRLVKSEASSPQTLSCFALQNMSGSSPGGSRNKKTTPMGGLLVLAPLDGLVRQKGAVWHVFANGVAQSTSIEARLCLAYKATCDSDRRETEPTTPVISCRVQARLQPQGRS